MTSERSVRSALPSAVADQFTGEIDSAQGLAWEEVAEGRFMPRRIRGSYQGRALG